MNATCPTCQTVFRIDPAKVPAGGVRARCNVCRREFSVEGYSFECPGCASQNVAMLKGQELEFAYLRVEEDEVGEPSRGMP